MRHTALHEVEQELDKFIEEGGQIGMVNIDFINTNAKSPG